MRFKFSEFGEVAVGGSNPVVRFLGGLKLVVQGDNIRPITDDDSDRELINRWMIDAWLDRRIQGDPRQDKDRECEIKTKLMGD